MSKPHRVQPRANSARQKGLCKHTQYKTNITGQMHKISLTTIHSVYVIQYNVQNKRAADEEISCKHIHICSWGQLEVCAKTAAAE